MKKMLSPLQKFNLKFGICTNKIFLLSQEIGSNPNNLKLKLKRLQNVYVRKHFDLEYYSKLKVFIKKRLLFFWNIRLYRGIRHMLRLPSRGQRTHTNRKTKKKFKF